MGQVFTFARVGWWNIIQVKMLHRDRFQITDWLSLDVYSLTANIKTSFIIIFQKWKNTNKQENIPVGCVPLESGWIPKARVKTWYIT